MEAPAEAPPATAKVAVWDLPVRLFHWALVGLIAFSWWSAKNGELELHMYSGYAILTAVIMFWIGSGPVRGFAVTLGIGVLTSSQEDPEAALTAKLIAATPASLRLRVAARQIGMCQSL